MNDIQEFVGLGLAEYPKASEMTYYDVRLEVPAQYYSLDDLKGLRKFIKGLEKQIKAKAERIAK